jgi:hypothetical protein
MSSQTTPSINGAAKAEHTAPEHGPGIDEAPLNDLDDGEDGLDPDILSDGMLEDGGLGLG